MVDTDMTFVENANLDPTDVLGRLKDLERRVHTLEDRHDDLIRASRSDVESLATVMGTPPPETTVSDREREAEERAATGHAHSDVRPRETRARDREKFVDGPRPDPDNDRQRQREAPKT